MAAQSLWSGSVLEQIASMEAYDLNLRDFLKLAQDNPELLRRESAAQLRPGTIVVCATDSFDDLKNISDLGLVGHDGAVKLPKKHPDGGGLVNVFVHAWDQTGQMPKNKKKLTGKSFFILWHLACLL